jgi:hypothetical protein
MPSLAHIPYFKNYTYSLLTVEADQRGFIVGESRVGVTKLRTSLGVWTSIKDTFTSLAVTLGCRVVDGAWLEPEVSSLTITTRTAANFQTYDGAEIRMRYDGVDVFNGYITESTLSAEIDDDNTEAFTVTLTARGFEDIKNKLPAVGTARTMTNYLSGGSTSTVAWADGKIRKRAADVTGRTIVAEDMRADVQLEAILGVENDVSGTQGERLADLAVRSGTLLDQSGGSQVSFRSYQGVPVWVLENEHVTQGYSVAVDRESATALFLTRKEDETFTRAYRAGTGQVVAERTISSFAPNNDWDMTSFAATVPLQGSEVYLASATAPRSDDLPLTSRLPIKASFRRNGKTYRGAITTLSHTITPERWMMNFTCAPVHLVTRVSDLTPSPPSHVKVTVSGTTATVSWAVAKAGTAQGTPIALNYFTLIQAEADLINVGDELRAYTSAGVLKEDTIFTVTSKSAPFLGFVNVFISPDAAATIVGGDTVSYNDYGPTPDGGWVVYYTPLTNAVFGSVNQKALGPNTIGGSPSTPVASYLPSVAIPGLTSGISYRFTVYAVSTIPNIRSAPSAYVDVAVP